MTLFQRTLTNTIVAAALAGSFAISANAQSASAQQPATTQATAVTHGKHQVKSKDKAQAHATRAERLKTILQIQPNQENAWNNYVKATTPEPRTAEKNDRADMRKLTTPERLDAAQKLRKERTSQAEQREKATRSFYSSLTPSQQKAFDEIATQKPRARKASNGHGKQVEHKRGNRPEHRSAPSPAPAA